MKYSSEELREFIRLASGFKEITAIIECVDLFENDTVVLEAVKEIIDCYKPDDKKEVDLGEV